MQTQSPPLLLANPWYQTRVMADPILDQVLLFYLSEAWQGSSDIGEVLDTASRVLPDDEHSWTREWQRTAERLRARAMTCEQAGHPFSAGQAYLRAATYYRASLHRYPTPSDQAVKDMAALEVASFTKAIRLLGIPAQPVRIPYEGTTLPGYFFRSPVARGKAPVLIVHQGRDAWAEDCLYLAQEAMRRGYHALLFDGPGMGQTIRLQGLAFRPDWEKVITPVVDYAVKTPGVDPKRIALMGISMGGALAPRAASFEKRLKLLIANPGVFEWSRIYTSFVAEGNPEIAELPAKDPERFNALMAQAAQASPLLKWGLADSMWRHGVPTPAELFLDMKRYTNRGYAGRIVARTLVIDGEAEEFGQAKELYAALTCPKDYLLFTAEEAAPLHVQVGALAVSSQRIFDWIDENI
ncbi:MAG TPA: alpha/beta fold hydrolase [Spirochaetia bacterium]|nr:alpha/beta fold hydrolase [Spirochaetia bacterium]